MMEWEYALCSDPGHAPPALLMKATLSLILKFAVMTRLGSLER
jgi:hypothetical protein